MAVANGITLTGDKELIRLMKELPATVLRKAVRPASSKAWTPANKAAKRLAKNVGENHALSKSIAKKQKTYINAGVVVQIVGPRSDFVDRKTGHRPAMTAHLTEFGVEPHVVRVKNARILSNINSPRETAEIEAFGSQVQHPGQAAQPVMRPAFDQTVGRATQIYAAEMAILVPKEAAKLALKLGTNRAAKGQ